VAVHTPEPVQYPDTAAAGPAPFATLAQNPYVGLRPFEEDEALLFFGRRAQVAALLDRLHRERFLAVLGSSGCGKSSLIRAGLIPKLRAGLLVDERDRWIVATMTPGTSPLERMAEAIAGALAAEDMPDFHGELSPQGLARTAAELGVTGLAAALAPALAAADANLLLLVDQFEELFRYRDLPRPAARREAAADFVSLLLGFARARDVPVYVVLTMRSDFLGDSDAFLGLPEMLNRAQFLVPRLARDELREAIVGPARLHGRDVAPRLVDRLLNDMGGEHDELPLLQHALMRMWTRAVDAGRTVLDVDDYDAIGTLSSALSRHADEALAAASPAEREVARKLFVHLTDTDTRNRRVRRPARMGEIARATVADTDTLRAVVDRFRGDGRAFLRASEEPPGPDTVLDISHEALIRRWATLAAWVDAEAQDREQFVRLRDAARRHAAGTGDLLADIDLRAMQAWWKRVAPTSDWADRYGGGFDVAADYLRASRRRHHRDIALLSSAAIALLVLSAWIFVQNRQSRLAEERVVAAQQQRAEAQARIAELQVLVRAAAAAYSPDRAEFAHVTDDGVTVVRSAADRPTQVLNRTQGATAVAFAPSGDRIAVGVGPELQMWAYTEGYQRIWTSTAHAAPIRKIAFSPNGALVATASEDRTCGIRDAATGAQVATLQGYQSPVVDVAFAPDGTSIFATSSAGEVLAWSSADGRFEQDRVKRTVASVSRLPRIYVQIASEDARRAATGVAVRLEAAGYVMPGVERVDAAPARSELRYFDPAQEADARDIAARLAASGVVVETTLVRGYDQGGVVPQYELWFAEGEPRYWFPVVATTPEYHSALGMGRALQERVGDTYDVDVYERTGADGTRSYAVTLGGYTTEAEARARIAAAPGAPADAVAVEATDWGGDLLPSPVGERVMRVISDLFGIPRSRIRLDSRLGPELQTSDDERTALLRTLEEALGVEIDDRAVANVRTVRQLVGAVERFSRPTP
jgi:energy-coupling factor transporter ATP-binding protein EcfA2